MYLKLFKRLLDIVLSLCALAVLAIPMLAVALVIKAEDHGPALFTQKRVGRNKELFLLYKFRTMHMDAPRDVPTHLMKNPRQYMLRAGSFLRRTSIDELPQLWNILKGDMSIIGPRPALWNQEDLVEQRDHYGANALRPGLTGLAQISGRDELEIGVKAKLDGEYTEALQAGHGFRMDVKCFFGTILPVLRSDGVDEGGIDEEIKEA